MKKQILIFINLVIFLTGIFIIPARAEYIRKKPNKNPFLSMNIFKNRANIFAQQANRSEYKEDEIIVKYKKNISERLMKKSLNKYGMSVKKSFKTMTMKCVTIPDGSSVKDMINKIIKDPNVEYAEPNYLYHADATPDDPRFTDLWGLNNNGQTGGTPDADIDATEAWDIATGDSSIVIAVIDTGIDYTHEDIKQNLWRNSGEIPGNNIDDDNNGVVDDIYGFNSITGSGDPYDNGGHGTHVSGTIGAVGNNSKGVSGVNWKTKIMALKFLNESGSGYSNNAIACIDYAVTMKNNGVNVRVTNNSWGGGPYSQALYDAIKRLRDADILFVASAGNSAKNTDSTAAYPASYNLENIISVAATDKNDTLAYFSNYGSITVDLAAPGYEILSTYPGGGYNPVSGDIFFDNVESGTGIWQKASPWDITNEKAYSGTYAWSDSPNGNYSNNRNNSITSGIIDLSSTQGIDTRIGFYGWIMLEKNYDNLFIDVSGNNGSSWTTIKGVTGENPSWQLYAYPIPENVKTNQFKFRFRLKTDASNVKDGVYLDNIGIGIGSGSSATYVYMNGTSMASPHVSGAATMLLNYLWNKRPQTSYSEIKNIILSGVDSLPVLNDKTLTGGRLNVYNSILKASELLIPNKPPVAEAGQTKWGNEYISISFDASSSFDSDGIIVSYLWDYGDGGSGTSKKVNHVYTSPGTYTATLTVTDNDGDTAIDTVQVRVSAYSNRVNCGYYSWYKDVSGQWWRSDQKYDSSNPYAWGFKNGAMGGTTDPIENTLDDILYQKWRRNLSSYNFNVPNGTYAVTLKFAEFFWTSVGRRIFDVYLEGNLVLDNYDIYAEVGHDYAAPDKVYDVIVTDGRLDIEFGRVTSDPVINAIYIRRK